MNARSRIPPTLFLCAALALARPVAALQFEAPSGAADAGACSQTAAAAYQAALFQAKADYGIAIGKCLNYSSPAQVAACMQAAMLELGEANALAADQLAARLDLCADLGEAPYDPVITPSQFVAGVTNPYLPWVPGRTLVYRKQTEDGLEEVRVTVLAGTRTILGIPCTRVSDVVTLDGVLVENTEDWYAQDVQGNVWYMGESTQEYENGVISSIDGSFEAGLDGAKPGIIMPATAVIGVTRRLEFQLGEAEDVATLERVNRRVNVPAGSFSGCRETEDETPLEPDVEEHKFYAPGVGVVLEIDADGKRLELVAIL